MQWHIYRMREDHLAMLFQPASLMSYTLYKLSLNLSRTLQTTVLNTDS